MTNTIRSRAQWQTALTAQFRFLACSRRPFMFMITLLALWAVTEYVYIRMDQWAVAGARLVRNPGWVLLHGLMGTVWALGVWRDPHRTARLYHWTLPLDVSVNDAMRVLAGAAWLMIAVAFSLGISILLGIVHGVGGDVLSASPILWLAHFTCALVGYLLVVPISTLSGRPAEHILIGLIVFYGLVALTGIGGTEALPFRMMEKTMTWIFMSTYGLTSVFLGNEGGDAVSAGVALPDGYFGTWLAAAMLWIAIGTSLFAGAMYWVRRRLAR